MNLQVYINSTEAIPYGEITPIGDGQLGWVSAAIEAGAAIAPVFLAGSQSGQSQYKGLQAITSGGNQLISQMQELLALVQSNPSTGQQAVQAAQQLRTSLDTPAVFYQAQHGSDAAALTNFKSQADALLQQIQAAAAASAGTTANGQPVIQTPNGPMVQTTGANGQTVLVPAPSTSAATIGGIPLSYLLIGGIGILGLAFYLR
jgi:hypothetical protein